MKDCTYYDLLGVSQKATDQEITTAKNFLVKKFHPDSNIDSDYDTTSYIQNILFAYRILSDPKKRRAYDRHIEALFSGNGNGNVPRPRRSGPLSPDFAPYWEAAHKLNELVTKCTIILNEGKKSRGFKLPLRKDNAVPESNERIEILAKESEQYITILKEGEIPKEFWHPHAMNWILFQWTQNRDYSYDMLFAMYEGYMAQKKANAEKRKIQNNASDFQKNLEALMQYLR